MKAAVCIGHSRGGDMGARSIGGVSEWTYNVEVGKRLVDLLKSAGVEVLFLDHYEGGSYGTAMSWVASRINAFDADLAIELHFNAASASAQGFEYLYWDGSANGKRLAESLLNAHAAAWPGLTNRGAKGKDADDRGSGFLGKPWCPSVIAEPFFGSNVDEWAEYGSAASQDKLATVYATGILDWLGVMQKPEPVEPVAPEPTGEVNKPQILASCAAIRVQLENIENALG